MRLDDERSMTGTRFGHVKTKPEQTNVIRWTTAFTSGTMWFRPVTVEAAVVMVVRESRWDDNWMLCAFSASSLPPSPFSARLLLLLVLLSSVALAPGVRNDDDDFDDDDGNVGDSEDGDGAAKMAHYAWAIGFSRFRSRRSTVACRRLLPRQPGQSIAFHVCCRSSRIHDNRE